jgi:hypothetical protein
MAITLTAGDVGRTKEFRIGGVTRKARSKRTTQSRQREATAPTVRSKVPSWQSNH